MNTQNQILPMARHDRLVIEELGDELLIYDTTNDRAHTLNRTAAQVWKLCDGKRSVSALAILAAKQLHQPISDQTVWYALEKLGEFQLLVEPVRVPQAMAGISRREFLTKFAVAAAVVPVVKTLRIPATVDGVSCGGSGSPCSSAGPIKITKGKRNAPSGSLPCCNPLICCAGTCLDPASC